MLDELIRSNAVDKGWAEELIAGAATLEDLERAAIGTGVADLRRCSALVSFVPARIILAARSG